jgi:alpha-L-fucosidase
MSHNHRRAAPAIESDEKLVIVRGAPLMDWHHPDGALCKTNEAARRRFVDYVHEHVRELCTNYGKVDILWYDVNWPLTVEEWEAHKLNKMVRRLQPDILINNRLGIPEDFQTPEQHVQASDSPGEACMTMNDSWGYQRSDDDWKSAKTLIRNLLSCGRTDTRAERYSHGP